MVRVVCPSFQRPRSRHSSGDSVNSDYRQNDSSAEFQESDLGTCSDSVWESDGGISVDSCKHDNVNKEKIIKGRKQRRRERNKVSAQAYRARRKEQGLTQQKTLSGLETHQKELMKKLKELEVEKNQVETFLRSCFHNQSIPWRLINNDNNNNNNDNNDNFCNLSETTTTNRDQPRSPPPTPTMPEVMNVS